MLVKNAINTVDMEQSELPDNGVTCAMKSASGEIPKAQGAASYTDKYGNLIVKNVPIPWTCCNPVPSGLGMEYMSKSNFIQGTSTYNAGEFRISFSGKEIGDKPINDDMDFVKLYGDHCENCWGQCETEITLTGAPNQILSGNIRVYAPAYTERTMTVNGKTVAMNERTGGIDQGLLVVHCTPIDPGAGRFTKCMSLPSLIIYARERKLDEPMDKGKSEENGQQ